MKQLEKHKDHVDEFSKELKQHYDKSEWQLTRFDTGAYWLEVLIDES